MDYRDYMRQQIDRIDRVLNHLLTELKKCKGEQRISEGLITSDQYLQEHLNLSIQELVTVPNEGFMDMLTEKRKLYAENYEVLALLLIEIADSFFAINRSEEAFELYDKTVSIFDYLDTTTASYPFNNIFDRQRIYEILRNRLN